MASKTRTQLKNQSDNTFQDAPPANITPPNHRQFNDDFIDSAANLKTSNIFEDENTFQQTAFFENPGSTAIEVTDGDVNIFGTGNLTNQNGNITATNGEVSGATGIFDVFKHKIDATPYDIPINGSIDLVNLDGNIITITNSGSIVLSNFINGIPGLIIYAKFINPTIAFPLGVNYPLHMNPGDIAIYQFTQPDEVQYLGIRRGQGQEYFILANYAAYDEMRNNELWQPGSEYILNQYYEYPTGVFWDVKLKAINNQTLESVAYIRKSGEWIPVVVNNFDLSPGTLPIMTFTNSLDQLTLVDINANSIAPQWQFGGSAVVYGVADATTNTEFSARMYIDSNNAPAKLNVHNILSSATSFLGRIEFSTIDSIDKFYANHGKYINSWGNHQLYENGFTATQIINENNILGNELSNMTINDAVYMVVNNLVTIQASLTFDTKFDQGVAGQEALLYFPLPFTNTSELGCGHGAVRFEIIANHENIGAIVSPIDAERCLVTAKWGNAISAATTITMNFNYTYLTTSS